MTGPDELRERAEAFAEADRWDAEAALANQALLDADPTDHAAAIRLGRCREALGELEGAQAAYEEADPPRLVACCEAACRSRVEETLRSS